jgi:hypothetical protein
VCRINTLEAARQHVLRGERVKLSEAVNSGGWYIFEIQASLGGDVACDVTRAESCPPEVGLSSHCDLHLSLPVLVGNLKTFNHALRSPVCHAHALPRHTLDLPLVPPIFYRGQLFLSSIQR